MSRLGQAHGRTQAVLRRWSAPLAEQLSLTEPYRLLDDRLLSPRSCEINVVHHCNLTCRSCSHLSPVFKHAAVNAEDLHADLAALAPHFGTRHIKLVGGEPLLHPDLLGVIDAVRASGVSDSVWVCTNGVRIPRMPSAFWERVDRVQISQYPGHELRQDELAAAAAAAAEHDVKLEVARYSAFRSAHAEQPSNDAELVGRIFASCQIAHVWRCHTVHDGRIYRCPQSLFLPLALDGEIDPDEGLRIEDVKGFAHRLHEYLLGAEPLRACSRCLGTAGRLHPHTNTSRAGWRATQALTVDSAVDLDRLAELERDPVSRDASAERTTLAQPRG